MQVPGNIVVLILFSTFSQFSFSQKVDSTKPPFHFAGAVLITNNGISLIPTFSLNKPAVLFNLSMGKGRLSFEPDLRFSLEGKPWTFLFWWRYRIRKDKLLISLGAHPAMNFKTEVSSDGNEMIVTRRFLAGELSPNYLITRNVSLGMYYLYSHGFDKGAPANTHFLTLNSNISNIRLTGQFFMRVSPQFYYLKQDSHDGFYFTATVTLAKRNFPISISSIMNKTIETQIVASKDFVWNISLIYSFSKNYVEK
jgi:hypothetical protein